MDYDRNAPRSRVNMTLNEDVVRQAREITSNLSETVEQLLVGFIAAAADEKAERERAIDEHIRASNAFIAAYGCLSDEFQSL
ncbi:MAG: type II toxin-antitoxin system CcdA family antitoxin [Janthinobacterium lividum]